MKLNRILVAALAVVALLVLYKIMQPPSASLGPEVNGAIAPALSTIPTTGRVTMIDLGATECIPCKMMAPILEELKREYAGKADIIFIDVWKDPSEAKKYGIRAIPTQIFFDVSGREVYRHTGFMDKKRIVENLAKLGVS